MNLKSLRSEAKKIKSGVADDTIFTAKATLYIAEKITELVKLQKPSDGTIFITYKIRFEHKNFIDALKEFQALKEVKSQ